MTFACYVINTPKENKAYALFPELSTSLPIEHSSSLRTTYSVPDRGVPVKCGSSLEGEKPYLSTRSFSVYNDTQGSLTLFFTQTLERKSRKVCAAVPSRSYSAQFETIGSGSVTFDLGLKTDDEVNNIKMVIPPREARCKKECVSVSATQLVLHPKEEFVVPTPNPGRIQQIPLLSRFYDPVDNFSVGDSIYPLANRLKLANSKAVNELTERVYGKSVRLMNDLHKKFWVKLETDPTKKMKAIDPISTRSLGVVGNMKSVRLIFTDEQQPDMAYPYEVPLVVTEEGLKERNQVKLSSVVWQLA